MLEPAQWLMDLEDRVKRLEESPLTVFKYKKLHPDAHLYKKHKSDSCWDVFATSKEEGTDFVEFGTGLAFDIPKGYEIKCYPRSSISNTPYILTNSVGVIDEDYKGEVKARFKILDKYIHLQGYEVGDRIFQIQLVKKVNAVPVETTDLLDSERGSGGFGSTGKK